jgi:serine/threonine protein phosphatase PrpC
MGGIDIVDVSMKPVELCEGDVLLLATDGLYKSLGDEKIAEILNENKTSAETADRLIEAVKKIEGAVDNTTLAVIM